MATHKSAEKRNRQSERRRRVNKAVSSRIKTKVREVIEAVDEKNATRSKEALVEVMRGMYRASTKGVVHKKTAARKVSRLTKKVRALG